MKDGNHAADYSPHAAYPCAGDDRWCVITVGSDDEWRRLCAAIGRAELAGDARFATHADRKAHEGELDELIAASGEAHAALWTFALDIDLSGSVRGDNMAVDDPIQWMLADPRRLVRRRRDAVWLRIVDVPTALAGRRYGSSGRLVIDVRDSFCDWMAGRYALQASPDGASCRPTTDSAELALSAAALGAIYLGGVRASTLARAGQIEERTSGALLRADELFASDRAPWNPDFF